MNGHFYEKLNSPNEWRVKRSEEHRSLFRFRKVLCRCRDGIVQFSFRALGLEDPWDYWHESCWLTTRSNKTCNSCSLSLGGNGAAMMGNKHVTVAFSNNKNPTVLKAGSGACPRASANSGFLSPGCAAFSRGGGRPSYCTGSTVTQEGAKWGSWCIFNDPLLTQSSDFTFFHLEYLICRYWFWSANFDFARHP